MAKGYVIRCPKCGYTFEIIKGETELELQQGVKLPESRLEDTDILCPRCMWRINVNDPDFQKHVISMMMID